MERASRLNRWGQPALNAGLGRTIETAVADGDAEPDSSPPGRRAPRSSRPLMFRRLEARPAPIRGGSPGRRRPSSVCRATRSVRKVRKASTRRRVPEPEVPKGSVRSAVQVGTLRSKLALHEPLGVDVRAGAGKFRRLGRVRGVACAPRLVVPHARAGDLVLDRRQLNDGGRQARQPLHADAPDGPRLRPRGLASSELPTRPGRPRPPRSGRRRSSARGSDGRGRGRRRGAGVGCRRKGGSGHVTPGSVRRRRGRSHRGRTGRPMRR